MRATVEQALRRAADEAGLEAERLADAQRDFLRRLPISSSAHCCCSGTSLTTTACGIARRSRIS